MAAYKLSAGFPRIVLAASGPSQIEVMLNYLGRLSRAI